MLIGKKPDDDLYRLFLFGWTLDFRPDWPNLRRALRHVPFWVCAAAVLTLAIPVLALWRLVRRGK